MSNNKTPSYIIKATSDYQKRNVRKAIIFNKVNDKDLIEAIDNDDTPFATTAKEALRQYYKLKKP